MKEAAQLEQKIAEVQELLHTKFGVKPRPLPRMLKRVGRQLPRRMRAHGQLLARAQPLAAHPKLARQVDWPAVEAAHRALVAHLEAIDVAARRKERLLNLGALLAFYVVVVVTAFVWWLWWAGHV